MRAAEIQDNIVVQIIEGSSYWANEKLEGTWIDIDGFNIGLGYTYLPDVNKFIAPQPFSSWSLNSEYIWQPPIAYPNDGKIYNWNEDNLNWEEIKI